MNFDNEKHKCLSAFSSTSFDKSPKGCIDIAVRDTCALLNSHPNYATTSSCSGRIAIFDHGPSPNNNNPDSSIQNMNGGKGSGKWLLSVHGRVSSSQVESALDYNNSDPPSPSPSPSLSAFTCMLKHEPLLLHVMCRDMASASSLLTTSLSCGFRESGITVSNSNKIIVAIRTLGLSLSIPVSRSPSLRVSKDIMSGYLAECNSRFASNEKKTNRLNKSIEKLLLGHLLNFPPSPPPPIRVEFSSLPPINVWGHTIVTTPPPHASVISFGGYSNNKRCNDVFVLDLADRQAWTKMPPPPPPNFPPHPVEFHASCLLPLFSSTSTMAVFGGRAAPNKPSNTLHLYDCRKNSWSIPQIDIEIDSTPPPRPRWGHTFTSLLKRNDNNNASSGFGVLAVLIGGRDELIAFSDVHLLCTKNDGLSFFWKSFEFAIYEGHPVFHHSACLQPSCGNVVSSVIVFGGLSDPGDLLEGSESGGANPNRRMLHIASDGSEVEWEDVVVGGPDNDHDNTFASSACALTPFFDVDNANCDFDNEAGYKFVALCGGVEVGSSSSSSSSNSSNNDFLRIYEAITPNTLVQRKIEISNNLLKEEKIDVSGMFHQKCVVIKGDGFVEIIEVGGGVPAFAFGPVFSPCYSVKLFLDAPPTASSVPVTTSTLIPILVSAVPPPQTATPVVYAKPSNVKQIKTDLERINLLDKNFRIAKKPTSNLMAIPVRPTFLPQFYKNPTSSLPSASLIVSTGEQVVPYSKIITSKQKKDSGNQNFRKIQMPTTHWALFEVLGEERYDTEIIRALLADKVLFPPGLEKLGSDTIVVPSKAFLNLPVSISISELELFFKTLAECHKCDRVVRRGEIDPNSPIRHSGHVMLYCHAKHKHADYDPGDDTKISKSPGWITIVEHGIKQSFDMEKVMFSRGNVTEKKRFGGMVKEGEVVLDLYAGIGYYTLPALILGKAAMVHACEWNEEAALALKWNLKANGVEGRCKVRVGDCRLVGMEVAGLCDRVSLGLLPSSEGSWEVGLKALKEESGGVLHVHGNVKGVEKEIWVSWLEAKFREFCKKAKTGKGGWTVECEKCEKVKAFAPRVYHYVADVVVRPGSLGEDKNKDESNNKDEEILQHPPTCALSIDGVLNQEWMREGGGRVERVEK